jgi:hypothetical protein
MNDQTGKFGNWINIEVLDNRGQCGKIIGDESTHNLRTLTIGFDGGSRYLLVLNTSDFKGASDFIDPLGISWAYNRLTKKQEEPLRWSYLSHNPIRSSYFKVRYLGVPIGIADDLNQWVWHSYSAEEGEKKKEFECCRVTEDEYRQLREHGLPDHPAHVNWSSSF